ncbi:MAG: NAD(P)H-dependent oxidoreductase subunit E [Chloroflexi bacterium]|nr:NAD(P)H-dependent oxidoreductase subunit E [Chloroflexota bacterium]
MAIARNDVAIGGDRQIAHDILARYVGHKGALLMALLDVQYRLGYIPESTVEDAGPILGYSHPEVWGVLTFYSDFRIGKTADHFIDICIDGPCHAGGATEVWRALEASTEGESQSVPRPFQLRRISCPRLCAQAPVIAVDLEWHGRMTPEGARDLANGLS